MTPFRRYAPLAALATPLLLGLVAGCASSGSYPTLARRPQEGVPGRITGSLPAPGATPAATPAPAAPASAAPAAAAIADLRTRAAAAHERFVAQSARDGRAIRAGLAATPGSEAWAQGTAALADLTGELDAVVAVQAELDSLYADQRIDGGDGGAIAAVRDQVTAWVADEHAALADLGADLGANLGARPAAR